MLLSCPCSDESVCGVGRRYATVALSGAARQLSQRESLWRAGQVYAGRPRPDMAQKGGPCCRGQRLLDNAPCQAVAGLDSGALPFPRHRALLVQTKADRHAKGSPFGGAGERSETERASRLSQSRCTAISRLFVRAILSQCKSCLSASLPSPSLLRNATSPKGRGFGIPHRFLYLFGEVYDILVLRPCPPILLGRG